MKNKIFFYLFKMKTKYIFFNIFVISLFIQVINILEITKAPAIIHEVGQTIYI